MNEWWCAEQSALSFDNAHTDIYTDRKFTFVLKPILAYYDTMHHAIRHGCSCRPQLSQQKLAVVNKEINRIKSTRHQCGNGYEYAYIRTYMYICQTTSNHVQSATSITDTALLVEFIAVLFDAPHSLWRVAWAFWRFSTVSCSCLYAATRWGSCMKSIKLTSDSEFKPSLMMLDRDFATCKMCSMQYLQLQVCRWRSQYQCSFTHAQQLQMWTTNAEQSFYTHRTCGNHSHAGEHKFYSCRLSVIVLFPCL